MTGVGESCSIIGGEVPSPAPYNASGAGQRRRDSGRAAVENVLSAQGGVLTDVGRRRQVNEDWCGSLEPHTAEQRERDGWLWVVADGVGAFGHGDEASQAAGEAILTAYRQAPQADLAGRLRQAVQAGNRAVWERRRELVRRGQ